jgi:hypothetical protein
LRFEKNGLKKRRLLTALRRLASLATAKEADETALDFRQKPACALYGAKYHSEKGERLALGDDHLGGGLEVEIRHGSEIREPGDADHKGDGHAHHQEKDETNDQ